MSLATDARQSARALLAQPGLTIIAVLALTLGIGLTTMMFSIIQGALLRGLPFDNADRIGAIGVLDTARGDSQAQNVGRRPASSVRTTAEVDRAHCCERIRGSGRLVTGAGGKAGNFRTLRAVDLYR